MRSPWKSLKVHSNAIRSAFEKITLEEKRNKFIHLPNIIPWVRHCARLMKRWKQIRSLTLELEIRWLQREHLGVSRQAVKMPWTKEDIGDGGREKWAYLIKSYWVWVVKEGEKSIKRFFLWFRLQGGWWSHLLRWGTLLKEQMWAGKGLDEFHLGPMYELITWFLFLFLSVEFDNFI